MAMLLIRADGNAQIGIGHVMRCLALAQAWRSAGGACEFVGGPKCFLPEQRFRQEGITWRHLGVNSGSPEDARETAVMAKEKDSEWVVIDGYVFDGSYQRRLKDQGLRVLAIDDFGHAGHYYADVVVNQNFGACESSYASREQGTRLLLGTEYALLRREFWPWRDWERDTSLRARNVVVMMGGADDRNVTVQVLEALREVRAPDIEVTVVAGAANRHMHELGRKIDSYPYPVCLETDVTDIPKLMASADIAITASGSTLWEMMLMQLPFCAIIVADNQRPAATALDREGLCVSLEADELTTQGLAQAVEQMMADGQQRLTMSRRGRALVDGRGAERVMAAMEAR